MPNDTINHWHAHQKRRRNQNIDEYVIDDPVEEFVSVDSINKEPNDDDHILYTFLRGNMMVINRELYDIYIKARVFVEGVIDNDSPHKRMARSMKSINTEAGGDPFKMVAEIWDRFVKGQGTWFVIPLKQAVHNLVIITKDPELSVTLFNITPDLVSLAHSILLGIKDANVLQDYVIPKLPGLDVILKLVDVDMWVDARTGKTVTLAGLLLSAAIIAVVVKVLLTFIPLLTKEVLTAMVGFALNISAVGLTAYKNMKANQKLYGRFDNVDNGILEIKGLMPKVVYQPSPLSFWL